MLTPRTLAGVVATSMVLGMNIGIAQNYPNRPIRIVTAAVGGGSDFSARFLAQGISAPLGQPIIVENRPSGVIPGETVAKAPPDGYTLLLGSTSLWVGPLLRETPYDAVRDFVAVSTVSRAPLILVVTPSLPVKSVKELVALAKAKPGALNYGTGSLGASTHLAAELLKSMAGLNIVRISYASAGVPQQLAEIINGQVQMAFTSGGPVIPLIQAGKLRGLAVTSAEPSVLFPGVATVAATGIPGYELISMDGVFAPAKTPAAIATRVSQEMVRFLNTTEAKERMLTGAGGEAIGSSPEEFSARIKSEIATMGKLIKDANIRLE